MELLVIWLGSVVVSLGMDTALAFKMFKDVADQGYKIDFKRFSELGKQLNPDARKMSILGLFIPIANILLKFDQALKYNNARPFIADQLRVMDCIEPFSKDEEENYSKKPTGLNAMITAIKSELGINDDKTLTFTDGDEKSSISYKEAKDGTRIITKVSGPVSRLSVEEQIAKIDEIHLDFAKAIKERLSEDELRALLKDGLKKGGNFTLDISDIPVKEEYNNTLEIYLEERKHDDGETMDWTFIKFQNGEAKFTAYPKYDDENVDKYKNMIAGSIIFNGVCYTPENITPEIIDSIKAISTDITLVAEELKPTYKPARVASSMEDALLGLYTEVPSPKGFRAWTYINASSRLENFISEYDKFNGISTAKLNIKKRK